MYSCLNTNCRFGFAFVRRDLHLTMVPWALTVVSNLSTRSRLDFPNTQTCSRHRGRAKRLGGVAHGEDYDNENNENVGLLCLLTVYYNVNSLVSFLADVLFSTYIYFKSNQPFSRFSFSFFIILHFIPLTLFGPFYFQTWPFHFHWGHFKNEAVFVKRGWFANETGGFLENTPIFIWNPPVFF